MNKAKILRLCNDIEDEVTDIAFNSTHKHIYDCCESIREYLKAIIAEITTPPKSNGDRIRQMTDEELAEMVSMKVCKIVKPDGNDCPKGFYFGKCDKCVLKWLKQEVSEDAGTAK